MLVPEFMRNHPAVHGEINGNLACMTGVLRRVSARILGCVTLLRSAVETNIQSNPMQATPRNLISVVRGALCLALLVGVLPQLQAADVTGTWGWTTPGRQGGEPRKSTLALKVEGQKLIGKLTRPGRQGGDPRVTEITDGKVEGDEITFTIKREFNNNTFVMKYMGKVAKDVIKGKIEYERNGEKQEREWEAKREPAKKQ